MKITDLRAREIVEIITHPRLVPQLPVNQAQPAHRTRFGAYLESPPMVPTRGIEPEGG